MKTRILVVLLFVMLVSTSVTSAKEFNGDILTDSIFKQMCEQWQMNGDVVWNGDVITYEEARDKCVEANPGLTTDRDVWKHYGHSSVSYKSSSGGNTVEHSDVSGKCFEIHTGEYGGDGDLNIHDNMFSGINVKYTGTGSVNVYDNTICAVSIHVTNKQPVNTWNNFYTYVHVYGDIKTI